MNKTEETGGRERSIAATWRRKNRSEKLYFPLPRVTSARLKVNSCKYSSSFSLIIIYSILLLLFENFKTIQKISNKRKKEKEQNCIIRIKIRIRENGNSIGEERLRLRKRRAGIGFAEAMLDAKWKITGQRGSLALEHIRRRV